MKYTNVFSGVLASLIALRNTAAIHETSIFVTSRASDISEWLISIYLSISFLAGIRLGRFQFSISLSSCIAGISHVSSGFSKRKVQCVCQSESYPKQNVAGHTLVPFRQARSISNVTALLLVYSLNGKKAVVESYLPYTLRYLKYISTHSVPHVAYLRPILRELGERWNTWVKTSSRI